MSDSRDEAGWGKDRPDFEEIFKRYYSPVCHFFMQRGIPSEDAQDLAQETFLRAFRSLDGLRTETSFHTWLFTIAINVWRNRLRRSRAAKRRSSELSFEETHPQSTMTEERERDADYTDVPVPSVGPQGLDQLLGEERATLLRRSLNGLPPRMRQCVFLRLSQGLKYSEIASVMQISIDTVKSQLHQASRRLQGTLTPYFSDVEVE